MFHDAGGDEISSAVLLNIEDVALTHFEKSIHALLVCLARKNLLTTDELRRGVESLEEDSYHRWGYYDRFAASMTKILLERNVISEGELNAELGYETTENDGEIASIFIPGDVVVVRSEDSRCRWRKPHLRTPGYIFGARGTVDRYIGSFPDPSLVAFRASTSGLKQPLYKVNFRHQDIWRYYESSLKGSGISSSDAAADDVISMDIYQCWLLPFHESLKEGLL